MQVVPLKTLQFLVAGLYEHVILSGGDESPFTTPGR
jgi:hypothetical protein